MHDVRYVAFCDILGFSDRILSDFAATQKAYQEFASLISKPVIEEVTTTMYSDAILMTGESLSKILSAVQSVWFFAQAQNLMIRVAVTLGRYWEQRSGNPLFVVSDALVRAVNLERSVGVPAAVIADDVEIPDKYWLLRFANGPFGSPLLHFRNRNIVNPFKRMWGQSEQSEFLYHGE